MARTPAASCVWISSVILPQPQIRKYPGNDNAQCTLCLQVVVVIGAYIFSKVRYYTRFLAKLL